MLLVNHRKMMNYFPPANSNAIFENISTCARYIYMYIHCVIGCKKYYIYFVDNFLLFPTVQNVQDRLTSDEVIAKIRHHVFFESQCIS